MPEGRKGLCDGQLDTSTGRELLTKAGSPSSQQLEEGAIFYEDENKLSVRGMPH